MFNLRLANSDDIKKVFELSNDSVVRNNSINSGTIIWEEHVQWFDKAVVSDKILFYIIETEENEFIGQVRIEEGKENVISISLNERFRGKGLASKILSQVHENSKLSNFTAYVKKENDLSLKSFLKAGYEIVNTVLINNLEYYKLNCKMV